MINLLSYLIIVMILVYMYYEKEYRQVMGLMLVVYMYFYYVYVWYQVYDVSYDKDYENVKYMNRMLWINTDKLDVMNEEHKKWARHVMIDSAPNKLGIYIDKKHANKLYTLKQMEIFKILFGYNCPDIYYKYSPNKIVRKFCNSKEVNINNLSLRYTI